MERPKSVFCIQTLKISECIYLLEPLKTGIIQYFLEPVLTGYRTLKFFKKPEPEPKPKNPKVPVPAMGIEYLLIPCLLKKLMHSFPFGGSAKSCKSKI